MKKLEGTTWTFEIIDKDFVNIKKGTSRASRKITNNEFTVGKNVYNLEGKRIREGKKRGRHATKINVSKL